MHVPPGHTRFARIRAQLEAAQRGSGWRAWAYLGVLHRISHAAADAVAAGVVSGAFVHLGSGEYLRVFVLGTLIHRGGIDEQG